jgi:glycosyltransferase involved in cell wall biosynthesis
LKKRISLTYIVPKLTTSGDEHFSAIPQLLQLIATQVETRVIAERGDGKVEIPAALTVTVLPAANPIRRMFALLKELHKSWQSGSNLYFVRVSRFAAILVGIWCRISGGRLFYWHCGAATYHPFASLKAFTDWLYGALPVRLAFKLCDKLATGPDSMRHFYVSYHGVAADKILILSNDVDLQRFRPATESEKMSLRVALRLPVGRVALIVHRLSPIRRHAFYLPRILQTLKRHPGSALVIVGDGPERRELEALIQQSSARDQVVMVGSKPHDLVPDYMRAADIFLNPSFVEGFPRVVIEAMACGLAPLVTDAGGSADLLPLELKHHLVTTREDPEAFATTLDELLSLEQDQLDLISQRAAEHAKKYSTENVAREYLRAFFAEG